MCNLLLAFIFGAIFFIMLKIWSMIKNILIMPSVSLNLLHASLVRLNPLLGKIRIFLKDKVKFLGKWNVLPKQRKLL